MSRLRAGELNKRIILYRPEVVTRSSVIPVPN